MRGTEATPQARQLLLLRGGRQRREEVRQEGAQAAEEALQAAEEAAGEETGAGPAVGPLGALRRPQELRPETEAEELRDILLNLF